jgi:hypothetical protein
MQTVASFNYYSREARAPLIVRWIESLVLRFFVPGNLFRLGQFSSCHREVAFSDPFVAPPHFVTRCELGELCAFLSPLAESLRLAQRIWRDSEREPIVLRPRAQSRGSLRWRVARKAPSFRSARSSGVKSASAPAGGQAAAQGPARRRAQAGRETRRDARLLR